MKLRRVPPTVLLAAAMLAGCTAASDTESGGGSQPGSCEAIESESFKSLRVQARDLFSDLRHTDEELSSCEETGQPRATIVITVDTWRTLDQAEEFLAAHDWNRVAGKRQAWNGPGEESVIAHLILATEEGEESALLYLSEG